jgi:putative hydrolase of the HAD superfamily
MMSPCEPISQAGPVRAILFDVGRTLYQGKGRRHVAAAYTRAACEALGVAHAARTDAEIEAAYQGATAVIRARHADTAFRKGGPGPDHAVWIEHNAEVCARLGWAHPNLPAAIERQWQGWAPNLKPQPDCLDTLAALRARGYRLGVQSNTFRDHRVQFVADGLMPLLDACVLSYETGLWKPDPQALLRACEALGSAPAQTVYVGDKWEVDVLPARRAGLRAVLLAEAARAPAALPPGVWWVARLGALLDLLP